VHRTPVLRSAALDARSGATVFLKAEHLQKTGAFKARGATNAVLSLPEESIRHGVATHSSGNHAAALARAAALRGIAAHIVMPHNAPLAKQAAVRAYGGNIEFCAPTLAAREAALADFIERTGAAAVHPYNDWQVIAGQGTAALELLEDIEDLDLLLVPVGGGGLAAGTALAAHGISPTTRVIGVEPAGADDAARGFRSGTRVTGTTPDTIADGLRAEVGEKGFPVILEHVHDIVTVSERSIVDAMRFTWERTKQLIEPSAATVVAALLDNLVAADGRRVGAILSGGNSDLDNLPWRK
jgi:threonine dehydratase